MSDKVNQISSSKNYNDTSIKEFVNQPYKYGFKTLIENEDFPRGLNIDIVKLISERKEEPSFMLEFRLRAYKAWLTMKSPEWACLNYSTINYQNIIYYSAPKTSKKVNSINNIVVI